MIIFSGYPLFYLKSSWQHLILQAVHQLYGTIKYVSNGYQKDKLDLFP